MVSNKPVNEEAILTALGEVQEPELHKDLVSLNMIRDLEIEDGEVSFTVMLTTPACPLRDQIERESRQAVEAIPGVKNVTVKLDANVPTDGRPRGLLETPYSQCNRSSIREGRRWKKHPCGKPGSGAGKIWSQGGIAGCRYLWTEYPNHDGS